MTISYSDFEKVDIRVGRIIQVEDFPQARKPAYKLVIDFGSEIGQKRSSAQIVERYSKSELQDRLVLCVVNLAPKQIGPFISECLTLGLSDEENNVILAVPDVDMPLGRRLF